MSLRTRSGRARGEAGVAIVEFALILPILVMLVLGLVTAGLALSQKNSMTNAVREGSRLGATLPNDASWANATRTRVDSLAENDLEPSEICVKLVANDGSTNGAMVRQSTCSVVGGEPPVPADAGSDCIVKVWARTTAALDALLVKRNLDLRAGAVARYERGTGATCV